MTGPPVPASDAETAEQSGILAHSAVMAAGTTVSRVSGFLRAALLSYALGAQVHADVFTVSNTLPNALYILLAGGVFNAVLVPQLVRAMRRDPDRGDAYTSRVVTVAAIFLLAVTVVLVVAAPLIVRLVAPSYHGELHDSAVAFTRYCLPQVFFYGMFVLVGQILNARGSFGPMMWAPIANNVISVVVVGVYLATYGAATGPEVFGGFRGGEELLLGLGSTLGIVVQTLVLLPALRRAGFTYRPRLDLRGSGLGHTLRLGLWTVLFVVVNQVTYVVVQRLATSGAAAARDGTGATVYANSFLVVMVPHAIVTVSLATAVLPRLAAHAADGDRAALARTLAGTLRSALVVIVPFAALLPIVASDLAHVMFAYGAARDSAGAYVPTLSLFGVGVLFFTVHYLVLRGFYSLELNRTAFVVQCAVAGINVVMALALTAVTSARHTSPALVGAYASAYAVGSVLSYTLLQRRLGGLQSARLVRFGTRLVVATGAATGLTFPVAQVLHGLGGDDAGFAVSAVRLGAVGALDVLLFLLLARLLRLTEVTTVLGRLTGRVNPGRR